MVLELGIDPTLLSAYGQMVLVLLPFPFIFPLSPLPPFFPPPPYYIDVAKSFALSNGLKPIVPLSVSPGVAA